MPVFRDRDELPTASNLGDAINDALAGSAFLIVICSPDAARSRWVEQEIRTFKQLHGEDRILCLIVDGEPNAGDKPEHRQIECFPAALRFRMGADGELTQDRTEPIAADVRAGNDTKADAKLKLAAGLLGVGFDDLKQREQQRKQKRLLAVTAIAVMLLVVMAGLTINAMLARQEAERQRERAEIEAATAQRTAEFLESLFAVSDPRQSRGAEVTAREILDQGAGRIETELADEPVVQARLQLAMAGSYVSLGLYGMAVPLLEQALINARAFSEEDPYLTGSILDLSAFTLFTVGEVERAEELSREAIAWYEAKLGPDHPRVAEAVNTFAGGALESGADPDEIKVLLAETLENQRATISGPDPAIVRTLDSLCHTYLSSSELEKAAEACVEALELGRSLYEGDHPMIARSLNRYAGVQQYLGEYDAAGASLLEALEMNRRLYGDRHPDIASNLATLSFNATMLGDMKQAADLAEQSVDMHRFLEDRQGLAGALSILGNAYIALTRFDEAEAAHRESLALNRSIHGSEHLSIATGLGNLGEMSMVRGDLENARAYNADALAMYRHLLAPGHIELIPKINNLAYVLNKLDRPQESEALFLEALHISKEQYGADSWVTMLMLTNLARPQIAQGKLEEACAHTQHAIDGLSASLAPDHWRAAVARAVKGDCLSQSGDYVQAERELEAGLEILLAQRNPGDQYRVEVLAYLVDHHQRAGNAGQLEKFRELLAAEDQ
jgi:tetratricopeptide (TPR) repeat protein